MRNILFVALAIAVGCGGTAPPGQCPAAAPATGDACDGAPPSCYYFDACTNDAMGITALCTSGRWEVAYDDVKLMCPKDPVGDGDPCPCGSRQPSPCSWTLANGQTTTAKCDPTTLEWKITS